MSQKESNNTSAWEAELQDPSYKQRTVAIVSTDQGNERTRRLANMFFGLAAFVIAMTIFWVTFLLVTKYTDQSDKISDLIETNTSLQEQNAEALDALSAIRETAKATAEVDACYSSYTSKITESASLFATNGTGQLTTMIVQYVTNDPALDPALRKPTLSEFTLAVESTNILRANYTNAVNDRGAWVAAGQPVPCPLGTVTQNPNAPDVIDPPPAEGG